MKKISTCIFPMKILDLRPELISRSKKLIKKLAKKNNIPEYKVRDVINSYFGFAAFVLKHEVDFSKRKVPTVGIPFLGKFYFPIFNKKKLDRFDEAIRTGE